MRKRSSEHIIFFTQSFKGGIDMNNILFSIWTMAAKECY